MNLINDLENDLAHAFLVEKKHQEKIDSREAQKLIAKIKKSLLPVTSKERQQHYISPHRAVAFCVSNSNAVN